MAAAPVLKPTAMANYFLTSRLTAKPSLPFLAAVRPPSVRFSRTALHPFLIIRKSPHFTPPHRPNLRLGPGRHHRGCRPGRGEEEEESYHESPEEAKLFVGNLPYDVDSEKLANLFDKAGVVEVIYKRETDQSRGFGFVTISTVEEAERAMEMLYRYGRNTTNVTPDM